MPLSVDPARHERPPLPPYLPATITELDTERVDGADEDVHFTQALARQVIEALTRPGEVVFDPFAGFGTTLAVAHGLGRRACGIELLPERVALIQGRVPEATVVEGDARGLGEMPVGPVDLCLTSPPYMTRNDHPENPLTAYESDDGDYARYLADLVDLARAVGTLLRPYGHLVLNVANIRHAGVTTTLAWDVASAVGAVLPFVGETAIVWDRLPQDFTGDYLLTFAAPPVVSLQGALRPGDVRALR